MDELEYVRHREGYKELMAMPKEMLVYWMLTRHIVGFSANPSKVVEEVRWEYMTSKLLDASKKLINEMSIINIRNPDGSVNYNNYAKYMELNKKENAIRQKLNRYMGLSE